ncbi:unnamed protein product, partial [Ixodes pacificus]
LTIWSSTSLVTQSRSANSVWTCWSLVDGVACTPVLGPTATDVRWLRPCLGMEDVWKACSAAHTTSGTMPLTSYPSSSSAKIPACFSDGWLCRDRTFRTVRVDSLWRTVFWYVLIDLMMP